MAHVSEGTGRHFREARTKEALVYQRTGRIVCTAACVLPYLKYALTRCGIAAGPAGRNIRGRKKAPVGGVEAGPVPRYEWRLYMRSKWIDPRFIAPLVVTVVLALGARPAAATIETYNIIFTPASGPAPSGSITLNVTCASCSLPVTSFDITDTPAIEWTPADAGGLTATVSGGVVTSLNGSLGVKDTASPPTAPSNVYLGFALSGANTYNLSGPPPAPENGTYQLQLAAPEPVSSGLLLAGLAGYGLMARWRRRGASA